ncbi:hypothetical protein Sango_1364000 [Sesamum angolense]|uniref:Uncharacterized protein n=1 Tax=Sesamum angolense TaxID=2727404 RepID=A0AAE2BVI3_9LAMI|nr:hypothetical protein Sango_1364000 [Sesamum angolense]
MAVLIAKQERHSRYTNNEMPVIPTSLKHVPARKRKLILNSEDEEEEENVKLLHTESTHLSDQKAKLFGSSSDISQGLDKPTGDQGVSTIKESEQAKKSSCMRKSMRTQSVEDEAAGSSSSDRSISSGNRSHTHSSGELRYDSPDEDVKKSRESETNEEWDESKEKQRAAVARSPVARSCNQRKQIDDMDTQRTSKRRRVSSNKFLETNFILCDWVDDEEDVVSYIDSTMEGSDSINASAIRSSDPDTVKANGSLKGTKRNCAYSAKHSSCNLASSSSSSSSISKVVRKKLLESVAKNMKVHSCDLSFMDLRLLTFKYPHYPKRKCQSFAHIAVGNCNCNLCLHSASMLKTSKRDISEDEKIRHLYYHQTNFFHT